MQGRGAVCIIAPFMSPADYGAARERGRLLAEALDGELRDLEEKERSERLEVSRHARVGTPASDYARLQLQAKLASLSEFKEAVLASRSWRFLQWLRGLVGRNW